MRGYGTSVMPITAGCRKDIERLLKLYKKESTLSYKIFADLFEKTQFETIFMGRVNPAELYEFSEKLLQMAISYAMAHRQHKISQYAEEADTETQQTSISNVQSVHERTMQPDDYIAQIRVTPDQMADLTNFITEILIPERHVEAFVALFKLISGGAFRIYAFQKEYNPLLHRRYDLSELDEGEEDGIEDEPFSELRSIGDDLLLAQADLLCKSVLKGAEEEAARLAAPKKRARVNSNHIRSSIKENAYKSKIVVGRRRRTLTNRSTTKTGENFSEQDVLNENQLSAKSAGSKSKLTRKVSRRLDENDMQATHGGSPLYSTNNVAGELGLQGSSVDITVNDQAVMQIMSEDDDEQEIIKSLSPMHEAVEEGKLTEVASLLPPVEDLEEELARTTATDLESSERERRADGLFKSLQNSRRKRK